jgi:hypothetical protein
MNYILNISLVIVLYFGAIDLYSQTLWKGNTGTDLYSKNDSHHDHVSSDKKHSEKMTFTKDEHKPPHHHSKHVQFSDYTHYTHHTKDVSHVFDKTYACMIKGVVYKKGSQEILNNTKIVLHTPSEKVDSSITVVNGTYTLHVQETGAAHRIHVRKNGYKEQFIEIPDSIIKENETQQIKIYLEEDKTKIYHEEEEDVVVFLKGKVSDGVSGKPLSGAVITLKNNIDNDSKIVTCDSNGNYLIEVKKYSHYTLQATYGTCTSEFINRSTIGIKQSQELATDLVIKCE